LNPTKSVLQKVIDECAQGGLVASYFDMQRAWEGRMRVSFDELVSSIRQRLPHAATRAEEMLRYLNGKYSTRYNLESIPFATLTILDVIEGHGWWNAAPPSILDCPDENAQSICNVVETILNQIEADGHKRPYSLLTKYLHFCFPQSFPIFDAQSAASIQMWSYVAFQARGPEWSPFKFVNISHSSGSGYPGLVQFYRYLWGQATQADRQRLHMYSLELGKSLGGGISVLDLFDKLLWRASGDPLYLGLIRFLVDDAFSEMAVC